jgi:hypothetical protein
MDPDDLLDALAALQDDLDDVRGKLEALRHRLEEDRGDKETRELRSDYWASR